MPPPVVDNACPAQIGPNPYAFDCFGYAYSRSGYAGYRIPYFTLHPPVYYSVPVPRTYGYSPFAYPPGTMTPEISPTQPVVIQNKFVPKKSSVPATRDRVAQTPLRIANPFVAQTDASTASHPVVASHQPQVIFPAKLQGF
jgi:hypothetical protein